MPIYLYECDSCGVRFERMQRMSELPVSECPECEGVVHRIIQPVGVIFKGSGFYVTDNRRGSSPTLGSSKETDKAKETTETKQEGPSETSAASKESTVSSGDES